MDLSGLIFVALAVAWAGYLLPRALRQYDDSGATVGDTATDDARVLTRTSAMMRSLLAEPEPPVSPEQKKKDKAALKRSEAQRRAALKRPASKGSAVRRRRILLVLVLATAGVGGAAGLGYLPMWSVAVPGGLTLAWLVLCILMARAERRAARRTPRAVVAAAPDAEVVDVDEPSVDLVATVAPAEDAHLWDPLPLTLPTYVGKPVARRTARAIALTGMTSSGHDAADSALARQVRGTEAPTTAAPAEERRAETA